MLKRLVRWWRMQTERCGNCGDVRPDHRYNRYGKMVRCSGLDDYDDDCPCPKYVPPKPLRGER